MPNKTLLLSCVFLSYVGLSFGVAEKSLMLKAVDGTLVEIAPGEVRQAYLELVKRHSNNAKAFYSNGDGSVTIDEPRFVYNGKNVRISSRYMTLEAWGACRLFGFKQYADDEYEITKGELVVVLNDDGTVGKVRVTTGKEGVIKSVTCRKPL